MYELFVKSVSATGVFVKVFTLCYNHTKNIINKKQMSV